MFTLIILYCMIHILFGSYFIYESNRFGLDSGKLPYVNIVFFSFYLLTQIWAFYTFYGFVGGLCVSFALHSIFIKYELKLLAKDKLLLWKIKD